MQFGIVSEPGTLHYKNDFVLTSDTVNCDGAK